MSWDGIYIAKVHFAPKRSDGTWGPVVCKRRFVKRKTSKEREVSCFACMKVMGIIA